MGFSRPSPTPTLLFSVPFFVFFFPDNSLLAGLKVRIPGDRRCYARVRVVQASIHRRRRGTERNVMYGVGLRQSGNTTVRFVRCALFRCTTTLLGVQSWVRFCQQEFGEFPRLVGRYCSYLLPKQAGGTPQILVDKISYMTGRLRVYRVPQKGLSNFEISRHSAASREACL